MLVQDRLRLQFAFSVPRERGAAHGHGRLACLRCRKLRRLLDVLQLMRNRHVGYMIS